MSVVVRAVYSICEPLQMKYKSFSNLVTGIGFAFLYILSKGLYLGWTRRHSL